MNRSDWPWQHAFPPFFTMQPNLETRKRQLSVWCDLVLKFYRVTKQYIIDMREVASSPLFSNSEINRTLSTEDIAVVLEELMSTGHAEPVDKSRSRWFIYWHTLDEWSSIIYDWASQNNQIGTVCTFFEIRNEQGAEFNGMPEEILVKVLQNLESKQKAEIIMFDDHSGVKFF